MIPGLSPARAQEQHKRKVPGLAKITAGPSQQAFNGVVQSLDFARNLLTVNSVEGSNTEFFPLSKGMRVSRADGVKLKLTALTPGTNVMIIYELKGERRMVKRIDVLAGGTGGEKKKSPPRS